VGAAYQPDSNSLSKLTYYCSLKPYKLTKVARALLRRVESDAPRAPSPRNKARLCISLTILKRLIEDCRSELSFFAREAIEIMDVALQAKDNSPYGRTRVDLDVAERAAGAVSFQESPHPSQSNLSVSVVSCVLDVCRGELYRHRYRGHQVHFFSMQVQVQVEVLCLHCPSWLGPFARCWLVSPLWRKSLTRTTGKVLLGTLPVQQHVESHLINGAWV
jgi:hypothetical protein